MAREYAVFLRGITQVPMAPFRAGLEELGLTDVASYGGTGNFVFNAQCRNADELEVTIAEKFGTPAFVLQRAELQRVLERNPYPEDPKAIVILLDSVVSAERLRAFKALAFETEPPMIVGRAVYYVLEARERGKRSQFDFERFLGVRATGRYVHVLRRVLDRMNASPTA